MKNAIIFLFLLLPFIAPCQNLDSLFSEAKTSVDSIKSGKDLVAAFDAIKVLYQNVEVRYDIVKQSDSPDELQSFVDSLAKNLPALLTSLLVFLYGIFKKNPEGTIKWLGDFFAKFRTRWVVVATSVTVGAVWSLFFRVGHFDPAILPLIKSVVGTFFMALGIANFSTWTKASLVVPKNEA